MYVSIFDCQMKNGGSGGEAVSHANDEFRPQFEIVHDPDPVALHPTSRKVQTNDPPTLADDGFEVRVASRSTSIMFTIVSERPFDRRRFVQLMDKTDLARHFKMTSEIDAFEVPSPSIQYIPETLLASTLRSEELSNADVAKAASPKGKGAK